MIDLVLQATAIEEVHLPDDLNDSYLEVKSRLDDSGNTVIPWPNTIRDETKPAEK